MITIRSHKFILPPGSEGYLYVEIKPHKQFEQPHMYVKIEPGQTEIHLPKGLNPKKVVRAWIEPAIIKTEEHGKEIEGVPDGEAADREVVRGDQAV